MSSQVHCLRWGLSLMVVAALAGCSNLQGTGSRLASAVAPYRVDVVQGNFVSREQVEAVRPGMPREQVRDILGTALVTSLFHAERWDYVFTLRRAGLEPQTRRLTAFFDANGVLQRLEGDEMPSESEFVASLRPAQQMKAPPSLEATPAQLARYPAPQRSATTEPAPAAGVGTKAYPPLER